MWVLTFVSSCTKDKAKAKVAQEKEPALFDCNTIDYSFASNVLPIFLSNCATTICHSNASAAGGIVTENYLQISTKAVAHLSSMKHSQGVVAMPYYNPKLPDSLIQVVECWVNNGMPNN